MVHSQTGCLSLYSLLIDLTYVVVIVSKTLKTKEKLPLFHPGNKCEGQKEKGLFQEGNLYEDETTIETQSIVS